MLEVFPRSIEGYGWITHERVDHVEEQYKECIEIIRSLYNPNKNEHTYLSGNNWNPNYQTTSNNNNIKEQNNQLIRYRNYIHELQHQIEELKLENMKLKEELKIFRDDILDNYKKTIDNYR